MKTRLPFVLALSLSFVAPAKEVNGVKMPDTVTVEGKELKLSGMGLRKKFLFHVYVAGFYIGAPTQDAEALIKVDEPKRIVLSLQRDLSQGDIMGAIKEGFERNSKPDMPKLQKRLDDLGAAVPNLKFKDEIALTYVPGKGTQLDVNGTQKVVLEGKDFADALFSVWFGKSSVDDYLKDRMLGH